MTKLVFLWHMHQPYYRDASTGRYLMPWVRLHALKGYYDIPLAMEKYGVKGVINVVPALIEQLVDYTDNNVTDPWLEHTLMDPKDMKNEEKAFVLKNFFMLNWERLVKTSPRYHKILSKRQCYENKLNWVEMSKMFSDDEIFDLQVLFNLKWFGFMARERYPRLVELDEKDRLFTSQDKADVLDIQRKVLNEIAPIYRNLAKKGVIELSFTPFYHPIMPLVTDTEISARSSSAPLPDRFSYPEDAKWHLDEGKKYSEKFWDREIKGMWPAEGSVSPEIIPMAVEAGVKWLATDEGILLNSLGTHEKSSVLYRPYRLKDSGDKHIVGFFRDKYLSDLLGFSFSRMAPPKAVDIFLNYVKSVRFNLPQGHPEPVVSVILDGENAWESYPDNGVHFINELFTRLQNNQDVVTSTFEEVIESEAHEIMQPLPKLFSGSWINSNYEIWIGNSEDNTAWEYLKRVRDFYEKYRKENVVVPDVDKEVMLSIYRAEGSDWFWWYGPQFSTENNWLFDRLFRRHLRRVYNLLGEKYPTFLDIPIGASSSVNVLVNPTNTIKPLITGRNDSYYEWSGAGVFENARKTGGAMYNSIKVTDTVFYGFDKNYLYFKIRLIGPVSFYEHKKYTLKGFLMNGKDLDFSLPVIKMPAVDFTVNFNNETGLLAEIVGAGKAAFDEVIEFSLDSEMAGLKKGEKISLYFKIISDDGLELERIPSSGSIDLMVPSEETIFTLWDV